MPVYYISPTILICAAILNGTTFIIFILDKLAARFGKRRVPEKTLLMLSMFGGWPGGWLAQVLFRHKLQKSRFQWRFALAIIANCCVLILFALTYR